MSNQSIVYLHSTAEGTIAAINRGMDRIYWVRDHMPVLRQLEDEFRETKPFDGVKITLSIHMEAKTAYLAYVLHVGGAEVHAAGSNPLSTQDDVALALSKLGVNVYAIHGLTGEKYENLLMQAISCSPNIVIDDGGDLIELLRTRGKKYASELWGGCEETTTGVLRLKILEEEGDLPCPMYLVNDAKCKHYYDNKYGTGQSVMTAIMDTTNLVIAGKTVVVAGFGWCGKGVAERAKGMGANVIVTEIDPFKALDATMNGFRVMPMSEAAEQGDLFITVTGCKDVITYDHMKKMKSGAILCNAGHFDCEVSTEDLKKYSKKTPETVRKNIKKYHILGDHGPIDLYLLAEGRLVNLASGDGHPAEIMDMSFSVQALTAKHIAEVILHQKPFMRLKVTYPVPYTIDNEIAKRKLVATHLKIDYLTGDQKEYLYGPSLEPDLPI